MTGRRTRTCVFFMFSLFLWESHHTWACDRRQLLNLRLNINMTGWLTTFPSCHGSSWRSFRESWRWLLEKRTSGMLCLPCCRYRRKVKLHFLFFSFCLRIQTGKQECKKLQHTAERLVRNSVHRVCSSVSHLGCELWREAAETGNDSVFVCFELTQWPDPLY